MSPRRARNASHHADNGNQNTDVCSPDISIELQQRVLGIFKTAFRDRFSSDLPGLLQKIKGHLYERDFQKAFGNEEYLEAYAVRWSASRALAYLAIFHDLRDHIMLQKTTVVDDDDDDDQLKAAGSSSTTAANETDSTPRPAFPDHLSDGANRLGARMNVTCLGGGGGAEAVASYIMLMHASSSSDVETKIPEAVSMSLNVIDIADWSGVLRQLERSITESSESAEASAAGSPIRVPLTTPDPFKVGFHQCDVLDRDKSVYEDLVKQSDLITLMFTLNELYTTSTPRTTEFLLAMSSHVKKGTLLLVVDSPGSYSTVVLGSDDAAAAKKKYPMQWLLDHTLLSLASGGPNRDRPSWEKLVADDSRWFRLSDKLQYPIRLENTRYQLHLYRRV